MSIVDAFAGALLRFGAVALALGPLAVIASIPLALSIRERRTVFWTATAILMAALVFATAGLLSPFVLVGALGVPVVALGALVSIAWLPLVIALMATRRPRRSIEAAYCTCVILVAVSASALAVVASASV